MVKPWRWEDWFVRMCKRFRTRCRFWATYRWRGVSFRSNVDQKIKRNLIIFVTARLMDAEGRPVRLDEDAEEIVEPLGLPQELPPPTFESPSFGK